ncbi:MAG: hypothetical protein IJE93_06290 [Clostridia bacterium]|nr:hypothetical protein [Clostridia bacterium]
MKLKASAEKITPSLILGVSGAAFVVFLILRFYQLIKITDSETGFFTDKSDISVILFYVLSIGAVFGVLILSYLSKGIKSVKQGSKCAVCAVTALALAGSLVWSAAESISDITASFSEYFGTFASFIKEKGAIGVASPVFAILAAVVLLINAVCYFTGSSLISKMKLLLLIPVLWSFTQTIGFFSITASYLKVGQLLITIFGNVFFMLFLFEYARQISGIGAESSSFLFFATAIISAFLLLGAALPNLIFSVFLDGKYVVETAPDYAYSVFAGLFAISSILPVIKQKNIVPVSEFSDTPEEAQN